MRKTYVALVLDKSGSMNSVKDEAISGFNEQLHALQESVSKTHKIYGTVIFFDTHVRVLHKNVPVKKISDINSDTYQPGELTAMLDGVGRAIEILSVPELGEEDAVLVVTVSDGYENASKEYTYETLAQAIKHKQKSDRWTFSYLLANQDLSTVKDRLGASLGNISNYTSTREGTAQGLMFNAQSTTAYLHARDAGVTRTDAFYNTVDPDDEKSV